jgi:hypothetical protein
VNDDDDDEDNTNLPYTLFPGWRRGLVRCMALEHISIEYGGMLFAPDDDDDTFEGQEGVWIQDFGLPELKTVYLHYGHNEAMMADNQNGLLGDGYGKVCYWVKEVGIWDIESYDVMAMEREEREDLFWVGDWDIDIIGPAWIEI